MSELDQTIEELEAEVLAELEEAAHDAPTKGSAGAEPIKKVKKVGPPQSDEMQDGGDPVVEPDAADSPTDVAADIVADPSAPSAFVQGIMEGKEWVWNHGSLIEAHVAEVKRSFDVKKRQRQANESALAFAKFLKKL